MFVKQICLLTRKFFARRKKSQAAEEEENIKRLASALERAKTSFFAVMRPRLKAQTLLQYGTGKLMQLDRDLLILQRALNNKVPDWPESQDWNFHLSLISFRTLNWRQWCRNSCNLFCHVYTPFVLLPQNCWFWHVYFHKKIIRFKLGYRERNSFGFEGLIIPESKQ